MIKATTLKVPLLELKPQYEALKADIDAALLKVAASQMFILGPAVKELEAKVAEYWIVDFERQVVIIHRLDGDGYTIHGEFSRGQQASSMLLPGFSVDVASLLAVAQDIPD